MLTDKTFRLVAMGVALVLATGCKNLTSPNFNNGDLDELTGDPTAAALASAAQGLFIGMRDYNATNDNEYVALLAIIGREGYVLDVADPRFVSEMVGGQLNPGSPAFGGNLWDQPYENIRLADIILQGVGQVPEAEMPEAQKEALRGFTKTIMALDFLHLVNTRDLNCDGQFGCPIAVTEDVNEPAPAVSEDQVFAHIEQLLEEAQQHLLAASGASFPFRFPSGFEDFETPSTFLQFNRALRARVAVYRMDWQTALTALSASFLDTGAPLDLGAYHSYGTGSGDATNALFQPSEDPNLRAHPSVETDAEQRSDGSPDLRYQRKIRPVTFRTFQGVGSDIGFTIYNSLSDPVPIIRNEELILLRAEANIGLGNLEAARTDINFIRVNSGGLPEVGPFASQQAALDQLLYERRYSLLLEGGHRWIDLRRYGLLDRLPLDQPGHVVHEAFPVPLEERLARGG